MSVLESINEQANFELESAYIYLSMSAYLADQDLPGMKHFMDVQVKEEVEHAQKMIAFLQDMGFAVKYRALNPGEADFGSVKGVFEAAFTHEQKVTSNINRLVDEARKEDNKPAELFLGWYVKEQVEEEANFRGILTQLERAGSDWGALYQVDRALGARQ